MLDGFNSQYHFPELFQIFARAENQRLQGQVAVRLPLDRVILAFLSAGFQVA